MRDVGRSHVEEEGRSRLVEQGRSLFAMRDAIATEIGDRGAIVYLERDEDIAVRIVCGRVLEFSLHLSENYGLLFIAISLYASKLSNI